MSHPRRLLSPALISATTAGLLLGLLPYLYLPLRYMAQPAFNYAGTLDANLHFRPVDLTSLDGFVWLISGRSFAGAMLAYKGSELWGETQSFLVELGRAFFGAGIGPGLLGIALLWRRSWREGLLLALMFAFSAGFYINYRVMDKDTMFLPAYLMWALWAAMGFQWLVDWLDQADFQNSLRFTKPVFMALMAGFVLLAMAWNWRIVDLSGDWSTRQRGEAILQRVGPGAIVIGWWDTVPVIQYLQLVEGKRMDVKAVNRFLISEQDLAYAIRKEVDTRPIYIDSLPRSISAVISARPEGPVYRLNSRERASSSKTTTIWETK